MKKTLLQIIALLLLSITVTGQQTATMVTKPDTGQQEKKLPVAPVLYTITDITNLDHDTVNSFCIDAYVTLKVQGLDSLISNRRDSLMIWLNGVAFPNLKIWNVNLCDEEITFILSRDTSNKSPWNMFYAYPYRQTIKMAQLQVGTKSRCLTNEKEIYIHIRETWMIWAGIACLIALAVLFIYLVKKKELLRDFMYFNDGSVAGVPAVKVVDAYGPDPTNEVLRHDIPYSLARTQLAFWTLVVVVSLIFIWFNTDTLGYITTTAITLLGISGGTSVIAKIIDVSHKNTAQLISAQQFKDTYKSKGILTDIMSDEKGISVHRFQLVLFTVGLGIYFIWHVIYYLQMPDYSTTLLLLIGVSNTTYAGLKINEG
jgi:hypothetical protein